MTHLTYGRATLSSWDYLPALAVRPEGWRYEQRRKEGICRAEIYGRVGIALNFARHTVRIRCGHSLVMDPPADWAAAVQD